MTNALDRGRAKLSVSEHTRPSGRNYTKLLSLIERYEALPDIRHAVNPNYSDHIASTKKPGVATGLLGPFRTSFLFRR